MDGGSNSGIDRRNDNIGEKNITFNQEADQTDQQPGNIRSSSSTQEVSEQRATDGSGQSKEAEGMSTIGQTSTQDAEDSSCTIYELSSYKEHGAHPVTMDDIRRFTTEELIEWAKTQKIRPLPWDMGTALRALHFDGKCLTSLAPGSTTLGCYNLLRNRP